MSGKRRKKWEKDGYGLDPKRKDLGKNIKFPTKYLYANMDVWENIYKPNSNPNHTTPHPETKRHT